MAYPAIDANTLAAYEFDEASLTFRTEQQTTALGLDSYGGPYTHVPEHYGSWTGFLESVANVVNAHLYDTAPAAGSTTPWVVGAPALFKPTPRGLAFLQGTATQARDYVVIGGGPTSLMKTVSMWVQPFNVAQVQELLHKEYFDCTPADGVKSANWAAPFYAGFHLYVAGAASGSWGAEVNIGGTVQNITIGSPTEEHCFLRANLWNHIGCTYDGTTFKAYCNGQLAKSLAVAGAIDYGAGKWVLGPLRAEAGSISAPNAVIKRLRWEKDVKPLSYFYDCYTNAIGGGGGGPPNVVIG